MTSAAHELALLDSGANTGVEYVRHLRPELPTAPITLANGGTVPAALYTGAKGMPECHLVGKGDRILPLTWLIERFCSLNADWTKLVTPEGKDIDIIYKDHLPYIKKMEVDMLMEDLPHEDHAGRSGNVAGRQAIVNLGLRITGAAARLNLDASNRFSNLQNAVGGLDPTGAGHFPPPPAANTAAGADIDARRLNRQRTQRLRDVFDSECKFPPSYNVRKRLDRYRAMPDEYHVDDDDHLRMDGFADLQKMKQFGFTPGSGVKLWEWMSGSGRLSATARDRHISHLPPLDYRYGHNLGHWHHQITALFVLFIFPIEVLWSSPTCTPWSANARQWQAETREAQHQQESLTLQFLAVAFLFSLFLVGTLWWSNHMAQTCSRRME